MFIKKNTELQNYQTSVTVALYKLTCKFSISSFQKSGAWYFTHKPGADPGMGRIGTGPPFDS